MSSIWPHAETVLASHQLSPILSFAAIVSSATSDRRVHLCTANHPRARREEYPEFHVETLLHG